MPEKKKPTFWNRVQLQFLKLPIFNDWLMNRSARRNLERLNKRYRPLIEANRVAMAREPEGSPSRGILQDEWDFERHVIEDPIESRNTEKLVAQARKYGILVPPFSQGSPDWRQSNATGDWILQTEAETRLRREVRDQRRAAYDEFRKWTTMIFGLLAFVLGLASLLVKSKQPDPCPRNYYRNDAGACVFAFSESQAGNGAKKPASEPVGSPQNSGRTKKSPNK